MASRTVAVFGGTGFLGRRVVRHLLARGFAVRVASRHPERSRALFRDVASGLEAVAADIGRERATGAALEGAFGAVNAVSLYVEHGDETFRSVHVEAARRVARLAGEAGLERLAHVSGIGADPGSPSAYVRSRGQGELAVSRSFPGTVLIRPAVMFGPDDAFVRPLAALIRRTPVFPMFGDGGTRLQPVHVDDVAEAVAAAMQVTEPEACYELGGPDRFTYRELIELIAHHLGRRPRLVPVPFGVWLPAAQLAELLPRPPITRNQIELMRIDNLAAPNMPGFASLGIRPRALGPELGSMLARD